MEDSLLPHPKTIKEISELLSPYLNEGELWKGRNKDLFKFFKQDRIIVPTRKLFHNLNIYSFLRAQNQVNEAINKLWATVESEFHLQLEDPPKKLCKMFSPGFSLSTTIPSLYYSEISAILSILSLFGICSEAKLQGEGIKFYNLVRTEQGFILEPRNEYLQKCFGTKVRGWHNQVLFMYRELIKNGIKLPELDLDKIKELKDYRNYYHYDLLAQPSMLGALDIEYSKCLPHIVQTIGATLDTIHEIKNPLPNKCDERFEELKEKIKETFHISHL